MTTYSRASLLRKPLIKKIILPVLEITETAEKGEPNSKKLTIPGATYFIRPKLALRTGIRSDGGTTLVRLQFNQFPVALGANNLLWPEASLYILHKLVESETPNMLSFEMIADDLGTFKIFADTHGIDWLQFPEIKQARPTYRFNGHLKFIVKSGERAASVARRQMGAVVGLYKWLEEEKIFIPSYPPWKESDIYVHMKDSEGRRLTKALKTTDLSIKIPKQEDPYDGLIADGGKLRPLSATEQEWVVDALICLGNFEMLLISLGTLLTGARIQTILTFRVKPGKIVSGSNDRDSVRIPVGDGTNIDTKNGKRMVLHIPPWYQKMLNIYVVSNRAVSRRQRAEGGDNPEQYLFLSQRGAPLYEAAFILRMK